jgi:transposase-like protein
MAKTATAYTDRHIAGSRKGRVHQIFDTKGAESATKWGLKNGLTANTLKSWLSQFRRWDAESAAEKAAQEKKDASRAKREARKASQEQQIAA